MWTFFIFLYFILWFQFQSPRKAEKVFQFFFQSYEKSSLVEFLLFLVAHGFIVSYFERLKCGGGGWSSDPFFFKDKKKRKMAWVSDSKLVRVECPYRSLFEKVENSETITVEEFEKEISEIPNYDFLKTPTETWEEIVTSSY